MKSKIPLLTLCLALGLSLASVAQAQEAKPAGDKAAEKHDKSLFEKIREGGWVMIPIGLCSVLTCYLIVDGVMRVTNPKKQMPPEQVEAVRGLFRTGKYVEAYNYCRDHPSAFANVGRMAISSLGDGKTAVEEAIMSEMAKENSHMQTFISYLSVIGVCAPMIGLLGTVTGMIRAFAVLGSSGIGDPSQLSAAIGEVLVATASGLFIAIPAFGAFYYLRARSTGVLHDIGDTMASLFRKMPYELFEGTHIGDDELYAAPPEWHVTEQHA